MYYISKDDLTLELFNTIWLLLFKWKKKLKKKNGEKSCFKVLYESGGDMTIRLKGSWMNNED